MHGWGGMRGRGAYVVGGVHGRGHVWQGVCVVGGACMAEEHSWQRGHVWQGGVHGSGHAWQEGGHACQERRSLQRTVRILLECILVINTNPIE